ncbi:Uncharacterized protein SCF082_LOCUS16402, partial [Durusdinium trenchii]
MRLFGVDLGWALGNCCSTSTSTDANDSREYGDDWAVHREDGMKSTGATPRPSQIKVPSVSNSARSSRSKSGRPSLDLKGGFQGSELEIAREAEVMSEPGHGSELSCSTSGPCTPRIAHGRYPQFEEEMDQSDASSISVVSDFQLSPRSCAAVSDLFEAEGGEAASPGRMSASALLKKADATHGTGHSLEQAVRELVEENPSDSPFDGQVLVSLGERAEGSKKARPRSSSATGVQGTNSSRSSSRQKQQERSTSQRSRLGQHLEETQEEVQVQVRRSRRSSRASTEQAPSSPSVKVDEQGRLRTWSGPEKLGPIAKAASEKDIFRSFSVWSDGSTPTLVSSKSQSSCQTSNSRSTSKASVTSSRKLFSLATSEASSQGGASVAPQLSPCNPDSAVILVDWDDTLCPTSWVFDQIRRCPDNKALAAVEKASAERLEQHCAAVVAFLRAARAVARVAIVTLATEDFFHQSAETFLESAHIKDLFVELGIEVHFAERPTQMTFPA